MTMQRAVLIRAYGGADAAEVSEIETPQVGQGQVLVRVRAAGVNGLDWKVRAGDVRDAFPLQLPAVLGIELAGVVEATGPGASRFRVGDRVMGPSAGWARMPTSSRSPRPSWRGRPRLWTTCTPRRSPSPRWRPGRASTTPGRSARASAILIHGGGWGTGGYAVQFARQRRAEVFATVATATRRVRARSRGAHVIDYQTQRFEEVAREIDLVLDYVGGEVLDRSWQVLTPTGAIVWHVVARHPGPYAQAARGLWFMSKPDAALLERLAAEVAGGSADSQVSEVVGFGEIPARPSSANRDRLPHRQGRRGLLRV